MLLTACTQHTMNQNNDAPGSSWSPTATTSPARYFLGICLTFLIGSNFFYLASYVFGIHLIQCMQHI